MTLANEFEVKKDFSLLSLKVLSTRGPKKLMEDWPGSSLGKGSRLHAAASS